MTSKPQVIKEIEQNAHEASNELVELIEVLQSVDINSPQAKLNEATISDNNGGRIEL